MIKIALTGLPGAGKSSSVAILRTALEKRGFRVSSLKLAAPLYDVQSYFYKRCSDEIDPEQQDGVLLNFLGGHFRAAAPGFMVRDLLDRCALAALTGATIVLCDDARPLDLKELRHEGFRLIRIEAPDHLRRARKLNRGDRFTGDEAHPTELGVNDSPPVDRAIVNDGSLAELKEQIEQLAGWLVEGTIPESENFLSIRETQAADVLVQRARSVVCRHYSENRHQIGAAFLTGDGRIFTGIHIEAMVGRASICAEAVALGKACEAGATDIRLIVSVRHPKPSERDREIRIVPPCGLCRELLLDYGASANVLLSEDGTIRQVPLRTLLPNKYQGTKWNTSPKV